MTDPTPMTPEQLVVLIKRARTNQEERAETARVYGWPGRLWNEAEVDATELRVALVASTEEVERLRELNQELEDALDQCAAFANEIENLTDGSGPVQENLEGIMHATFDGLRKAAEYRTALGAEPVGDDPAPTLWCPQCFEHDHNPVASCCYQCGERLTTAAAEGDPAPRELNCDEHGIYDEEQGPDCPACIEIRDFGSLPFEHPVPRGEQP